MNSANLTLCDRLRASLLALACGDALGAPAEFQSQAEVQRRWGRLTEMVGGGVWEPGEWTDDTGMALCVAEGILADPEDPVPEAGKRFLEWRKTAKDVGGTIGAALSAFRRDWAEAAQSIPQARQKKAAGNGSLMRTLPVALAYGDPEQMLRQSARLSAMTHWDPQAEVCCALYCLWVRRLLAGDALRPAWQAALAEARTVADHGPLAPDTPGPAPLPGDFWQRLESAETLREEQLQPTGYAGYVGDCLQAAAWCCLHTGSLEAALVTAVNLGGEADTIAAVAGGAAGAAWGYEAIPERWLERLHRREAIGTVAERLGYLRRHLEVYSGAVPPAFEHCEVMDRVFAGRNPLTARDVERLAALGVTHILDLREEWEWNSPRHGWEALQAIERRSLDRRHIPIPDGHAPSPAQLDEACAYLSQALADPEARVYVHCRAGQERTAAILTAYCGQRDGTSCALALATLKEARPTLRLVRGQEPAVTAWLRERTERR